MMEIKLNFGRYKKLFCIDPDKLTIQRIFQRITKYITHNLTIENIQKYDLFWKDDTGDFIYFNSPDELAEIIKLNKSAMELFIQATDPNSENSQPIICHLCNTLDLQSSMHQCLHCAAIPTYLCTSCFQLHENGTHFGILIKTPHFYQIHSFLYKEMTEFDEKLEEKSIINIGIFFQKILGRLGFEVIESFDIVEFKKRNNPLKFNIKETNEFLHSLSQKHEFTSPTILKDSSDKVGQNNKDEIKRFSVEEALDRMLNMGYSNENNILMNLIAQFDCDISKVLDWINRETIKKTCTENE